MIRKFSKQAGWTLFLDRDGVINERIPDDYVKLPDEFKFLPGVPEAIAIFAKLFNPVVVVTNQQGIGRGLMTQGQLESVHAKMLQEVAKAGGRIDAVFFSPDLKNIRSFTRKPAVGMGLKARKQFPSINFKKSIMAGDTYSDILFGHRLGMLTVLIGNDKEVAFQCSGILDYSFPDLISFAMYLEE
ncbi:MAG: HAD-IIIA family hydrolase [Bacteroidota bacterium]